MDDNGKLFPDEIEVAFGGKVWDSTESRLVENRGPDSIFCSAHNGLFMIRRKRGEKADVRVLEGVEMPLGIPIL